MTLAAKLDDLGNPAWIALTVVSFVVWWPLGLIVLGYLVGSGRMARWTGCGARHWQQRSQANPSGGGGGGAGVGGVGPRATGSTAARRTRAEGGAGGRPRAATAPLTSTARRPCAASKRNSANSRSFSTVSGMPRTRPNSTNSW